MCNFPFHRGNFLQSPDITLAAVESCPDECAHELGCEARSHDLGAEAEDVHVVVLDALVRRVGVVADRGADAGDLAGRDRGADPRAAAEHAALGAAADEGVADLARLVRTVDALRVGVIAEVPYFCALGLDAPAPI